MKSNSFLVFRAWFLERLVCKLSHFYNYFGDKHRTPWAVTPASLANYPPSSLGYALSTFLQKHKLELIPYHETHDVYHIITGYRPTIEDEVRLQFFLLGNRKYTLAVWATAGIGLLLIPEYIRGFLVAFQRGRRSRPIHRWHFEFLLEEPVALLKGLMAKKSTVPGTLIF